MKVKTNAQRVLEFHEALGHPISQWWSRVSLRLDLILEEFAELENAVSYGDKVETADALGDLLYVIYGTAVEWGIPIDAVFDEIHRSNMTKAGGEKRADGKSLKPAWYSPPNIAKVLKDYGAD